MSLFFLRATTLYLPLAALCVAWISTNSPERRRTAALLASLWNLPALLMLNLLAEYLGWWHFTAEGGALLGLPLDVYLGWAVLWGALPVIAASRVHLGWLLATAFACDLVLMPSAQPLLQLGENWWLGEAMGVLVCLLPAQLLGRWTVDDRHLGCRVALQAVIFSGLLVGVIPSIALQQSGGEWSALFDRPPWQLSLILQGLAVPAVIGLAAVQEFAQVGRGTPVPFDPPRRLVRSGPYAYVANPMQASACVVLICLGLVLGSGWLVAAAVLDVLYGLGLAGWHEHKQMHARFGAEWQVYRQHVRAWLPRWRPWVPPAVLYVAEACGECSAVGGWFARRRPVGLEIVAAEDHPTRDLQRMTYCSTFHASSEAGEAVGTASGQVLSGRLGQALVEAEGVAALARALEHLHLGWAFVGWTLRLPAILQLVQLLVDASGGGPRRVPRRDVCLVEDPNR